MYMRVRLIISALIGVGLSRQICIYLGECECSNITKLVMKFGEF